MCAHETLIELKIYVDVPQNVALVLLTYATADVFHLTYIVAFSYHFPAVGTDSYR
jgi:hypothetical protein